MCGSASDSTWAISWGETVMRHPQTLQGFSDQDADRERAGTPTAFSGRRDPAKELRSTQRRDHAATVTISQLTIRITPPVGAAIGNRRWPRKARAAISPENKQRADDKTGGRVSRDRTRAEPALPGDAPTSAMTAAAWNSRIWPALSSVAPGAAWADAASRRHSGRAHQPGQCDQPDGHCRPPLFSASSRAMAARSSGRPAPVCDEVASTSGNAAGRPLMAAAVSAMQAASAAGLDLVRLGQHDRVAHRRVVEHVEDCRVDILEAVACIDQHIDARETGAAAQEVMDQRRSRPRPWPWAPARSRSPACRPA